MAFSRPKPAAAAPVKVEAVAPAPIPAPAPEPEPMPEPAAAAAPAQVAQPVEEVVGLAPFYANFARVTGSPEELILDFGLNPQPFGAQTAPIQIQRRLVLNFFTAKRLLAALSMSVQRHEQAFGNLETDVNRRVTPQARAGQ